MYSFKIEEQYIDSKTKLEYKKAIGVPKITSKRALNFENNRKTLDENESKKVM